MTQAMTPAQAAAERLRDLREAAGATQHDLASAARRWGLDWTRATVANTEAGRREFGLIEAAVLTQAFRVDLGLDVEVADLVPSDGWIDVGNGRVRSRALRAALSGQADDAAPGDYEERWRAARKAAEDGAVGRALRAGASQAEAMLEVWPDATQAQLIAAEEDAYGDAEQKAARSLGVAPVVLSTAAHRLWGRGLTEERDRRAAEAAEDDATRRQLQAIRGHITRTLLEELRPLLDG